MIKHTKTIRRQQPTNYLSVFDHFVGLALKGLTWATDEDFHNGKSLKNGKTPTLNRWRLHYRNWNLFVRYLQQLNKGISSNNRFENFWNLTFLVQTSLPPIYKTKIDSQILSLDGAAFSHLIGDL